MDDRNLRRVEEVQRLTSYQSILLAARSNADCIAAIGSAFEVGPPVGSITNLATETAIGRAVALEYFEILGTYCTELPDLDSVISYAHIAVPITSALTSGKLVLVATESSTGWQVHVAEAQLHGLEAPIDLRHFMKQ